MFKIHKKGMIFWPINKVSRSALFLCRITGSIQLWKGTIPSFIRSLNIKITIKLDEKSVKLSENRVAPIKKNLATL
jgi:hypothetical protein